jgi:hypothetical protein
MKQALQQWLDCVPHNKFFAGYDGHHIEESVGGMTVVEGVVADAARDIARGIFRENAITYFKLEQKLGRKF